jgi:hypothetical protein
MPSKVRPPSKQRRPSKSSRVKSASPPADLSSRLRGLYGRIARQLGVDPSYVSRVARGERQSESVNSALRRELAKIINRATQPDRVKQGEGRVKRHKG